MRERAEASGRLATSRWHNGPASSAAARPRPPNGRAHVRRPATRRSPAHHPPSVTPSPGPRRASSQPLPDARPSNAGAGAYLSLCSRILGSPLRRSTELRDLDSTLSLRYSGARRSSCLYNKYFSPQIHHGPLGLPAPGACDGTMLGARCPRSKPSTSTRSTCRRKRISDAICLHRREPEIRTRPKTYTTRRMPSPRTE